MTQPKIDIPQKYAPLFASDKRYFVIRGGRSSGKSHTVNAWAVLLTYEEGHTILHTRFTAASAKDSIIADVTARIEEMGIAHDFVITRTEIINKKTGSKIIFKGLKAQSGDEKARLKSLSGITTWIVEEGEDLRDEDAFDVIDLSIRGSQKQKRLRTIYLLNPTDTEHFVYKRWFNATRLPDDFVGEHEDTCYILTSWKDVQKHLSQSEINSIMRIKRDRPEYYKYAIEGAWMHSREGVIYDSNHWRVGKYKQTDNEIIGLDFGFTHPTAMVKVSVDHENKIAYLKELCYESGMTPEDMHKFILQKRLLGYKFVGDGARPEIIEQLRRKNVQIRAAKKGPGSVLDGINLVQDYHLIVDGANIEKELKMYIWDDKSQEVPVKEWDDALDAVRYAVMSLRKKRDAKLIFF